MDYIKYLLICLIFLVVAFVIFLIVRELITRRYYKNSEYTKYENEIQDELKSFLVDVSGYEYIKNCTSKKQCYKNDFDDLIVAIFVDHYDTFSKQIDDSLKNLSYFEIYKSKHNLILLNEKKKLSDNFFEKYILKYLEDKSIKNVGLFEVSIKKIYTSPKKQNSYELSRVYLLEDCILQLDKATKAIEYKTTKKYQRQLLSDKLRYQILRRDNFKCQLCGATQSDGVKLHVDHIFPISKGGKTEPSNLRTLCERCNLGKGDSFILGNSN